MMKKNSTLALVFFCGLVFSADAFANVGAPNPDMPIGWENSDTDEGIEVYRKEVEGNPVVFLRAQGVVDAPIAQVASVILDSERAPEWVEKLEESKVLKAYSEREYLEYTHYGMPLVITDREFLTKATIETNPSEETLTLRLVSVEDPLKPLGKYVRAHLNGFWRVRSIDGGKKTYAVVEMQPDPKGSIPRWIVNLFQKNWAKNSIKSLRKQVAKPDVKLIPAVAKILNG